RRFRTEGRRLVDISDEALDGSGVEGATVSDFLLEELDRRREGRMRDIVATIQSDQYRLITAEPEGALVVQGGPGTGKTAVGLHRASWLLYAHREKLRRVLVVGPKPTFMDYGSHALPAPGWEAAAQRAATELCTGIDVVRAEEASARAGSTASCRCRSQRSSSPGSSPRRPLSRPLPRTCSTTTSGSSCCAGVRAACPTCAGATKTSRCSTRHARCSTVRREA